MEDDFLSRSDRSISLAQRLQSEGNRSDGSSEDGDVVGARGLVGGPAISLEMLF